jgi:hypothetical protein
MIVTFDTSILVRATKRSDGPARHAIDALSLDPDHVIARLRLPLVKWVRS